MDDLIQKILAGDKEAFRAVVIDHGPAVRAYIAAHIADPEVVDDLAQETFIAAYESLERYRPEAGLGEWIKGIARNKTLMHLRETYRRGKTLDRFKAAVHQAVGEDVSRLARDDDRARVLERLAACMEKLPERLKDAVTARYVRRERVQAVAERFGATPQAVSSILFRARKLLETCIGGQG
jgi:RNA polymerase sigma-70 factor, ECF subfamily